MQISENILQLIEKYQADTITIEEKKVLDKWYYSYTDTTAEINTNDELTEKELEERLKQRILATIRQVKDSKSDKIHRRWQVPAVAATLLVVLFATYFLVINKSSHQKIAEAEPVKTIVHPDIRPGGDKAILTLVDGSVIILDSASNGMISQQGNVEVQKLKNGQIAYTINGTQVTENDAAFYNTISTPRGGQYQATMSDGTKVWLNAASSIRFPVLFTGTDRKVEITGEVYLEVAKNAGKPFKVKAGSSEIEVLGTHFNINAYDDEEAIKTTLLEGLVKVSVPVSATGQKAIFLQPGQQSGINREGNISVNKNADIEEALAWKNGRFQFNSTDLKTILRQIARWYDVDIVYKGSVNLHFTGQLPRNDNVSKVFEKLAMTKEVHFKIDGKKIIVSK